MSSEGLGQASGIEGDLSVGAQIVALPRGMFRAFVRAAGVPQDSASPVILPAVQICAAPGISPEKAEVMSGTGIRGTWLCRAGDMVIVKVNDESASFVFTTLRRPGQDTLDIAVERIDSVAAPAEAPAAIPVAAAPVAPAPEPEVEIDPANKPLRAEIVAHIRNRGDVTFVDVPWAGRAGAGLSIEAFSIKPLEALEPTEIEYKALTMNGFETPWLTDGAACGTKGMSMALVGFAVRPKSGPKAALYDCEYSGYFRSGRVTGPLKNGTPCRSVTPGDSLEGLQVRIVRKRDGETSATAATDHAPRVEGPKFSRFRDDVDDVVIAPAKPGGGKKGLKQTVSELAAAGKSERAPKENGAHVGGTSAAPAKRKR